MTRIIVAYSDKSVEVIDCKAALLKMETNTIDVLHYNGDIQFINWNECKSYTLKQNENDTN